MNYYITKTISALESSKVRAETDLTLQRKLSQVFFFSSLGGGILFFITLAGVSRRMTILKSVVFFYGVSPVMKLSGSLALLYYTSYFI